MSKIASWPAADRPREKLLAGGAEHMTEAELLALVIGTGNASTGSSAVDVARALLARFGSLRALFEAGLSELQTVAGVGQAKAVQIKAALELARRLNLSAPRSGGSFRCSEDVYREFQGRLSGLSQERAIALLLDSRNRLIRDVLVSQGTLDESVVHPRDVLSPALREAAAAVVLIHNHPSGDPTPSVADIELTRRLVAAARTLGVRFLDHIIIGNQSYVSLSEKGYMTEWKERE